MNDYIDIIIPAYNAHKTIYKTLFSISCQNIKDRFKVYIVNDCSDKDYSEEIKYFKKYLDIKELKNKTNVGPGLSREHGLSKSNSPYVMFIDSDDEFVVPNSINTLYKFTKKNDLDVGIGRTIEVTFNTEFVNKDDNEVWMHGKMYKRSYIEDKNIHFNESRIEEDNYFNLCVFLTGAKKGFIAEPVYMWMFNKNSLTRSVDFYKESSIIYIKNNIEGIKFAIEHDGVTMLIANRVVAAMLSIYYFYLKNKDERVFDELKEFKKIYLKYYDLSINREDIKVTQYEYAKTFLTIDELTNAISFEEFLERVGD